MQYLKTDLFGTDDWKATIQQKRSIGSSPFLKGHLPTLTALAIDIPMSTRRIYSFSSSCTSQNSLTFPLTIIYNSRDGSSGADFAVGKTDGMTTKRAIRVE
jgi:hypothetical protein